MQTFLPYADFVRTAVALDRARLGKQRVETLQIMRAISDPTYGWQHHPVTRMWRGYGSGLMVYQDAICDEWARRGFADTTRATTREALARMPADLAAYEEGRARFPPWLGREEVHRSHRSNLLRKHPEHYAPLFPDTPPDLDYVWPGAPPA